MSNKQNYHIPTRWFIASACGVLAEFINLPLDLIKVRMQLAGEGQMSAVMTSKSSNALKTAVGVVKKEGIKSLFAGGHSALVRQLVCNGLGIGLYKPLKDYLFGRNVRNTFGQRVTVSVITGFFGQLFTLPLDVVKVRMQADGRLLYKGISPRYTSISNAMVNILRTEGWKTFFVGAYPALIRCTCMSISGVACYDQSREFIKGILGHDDMNSFYYRTIYSTFASLISGILTTCVSNPFDVIKTRMMNQRKNDILYKNSWDCFIKTLTKEGPFAFGKGFGVTVLRIVPWQFIFFNTTEIMSRYLLHDSLTR
ncbi:hypothetical protein WA158_002305 [Blastocystis sp. Blastoise]